MQLTWRSNYELYGPKVAQLWQADPMQPDFDLVARPDNALNPDVSAAVLALYFRDHAGGAIVAAARRGDWREVRRLVQGGSAGLDRLVTIAAALDQALEPEPMSTRRLRVTDDGVRLRQGPGTDTPILAELAAGAVVTPLAEHAWRQVRVGERVGWVASAFLAPAEAPPVAPRYHFDPTTPTELQVQDWTCSIRSVMWMLKSIGIAVTPAEAQDAMSPRYVSSDLGLLDATGAGIVEVLSSRWHLPARNDPSAAFDEVAALAGRVPVAIGLRNWGGRGQGHWSAVRGFDGARLLLANPAGTGPRFGHQALTRSDFDARGPASMVWIPLEDG